MIRQDLSVLGGLARSCPVLFLHNFRQGTSLDPPASLFPRLHLLQGVVINPQ